MIRLRPSKVDHGGHRYDHARHHVVANWPKKPVRSGQNCGDYIERLYGRCPEPIWVAGFIEQLSPKTPSRHWAGPKSPSPVRSG